jgi:PAS domain S-box-containing protein
VTTLHQTLLLDPYVLCDASLEIVWLNEAAGKMGGEGVRACHELPWLSELRVELQALRRAPAELSRVLTTARFEHRIRKAGDHIGILSIERPALTADAAAVEQARREVEERLQLAQEVAGLGICDRNLETGDISWSPEMYRFLGLEPGEVRPTLDLWRSCIHPDDLERMIAEADHTIADCGSRETEFRVTGRDGQTRTLLSRWKVFCGAHGRASRMVSVNLDVTQRRELDSQLREINGQLTAIIQASPASIVALTPNGLITLWNPAAERLFGWTEAEVLGKPLPFIPAEKRAEHAALRQRDLEGDSLQAVQLRRIRKDGTPVDISVSTATLCDPQGKVTGIMSLYEDVSERLRSERALRESEERFRTLVEATPQLVWSTTADGYCDYLSRQWVEYTGVPEREHWGRGWLRVVHPDDRQHASVAFANAIAGLAIYDLEYRLRRYDGKYRWFKTRGLPVTDSDGRVSKWLGTCTDIEDQRTMMDALLRANTDLQQFAYAAAHDLQEPLRSIALYSQLLQRKYLDCLPADAQTCLRHALDGAERMLSLVQDLLTYTQAATTGDVPPVAVDCDDVLATVLENLGESMAACGARLEASRLPVVQAHRTPVLQVFQNLMSNAIKYRGANVPVIRMYATRHDRQWILHVEDNGEGIPVEYQERIFGVFRRLHGRDVPGTGIGLAICKRIVEQYGGRIGVISEGPGTGSTFWFTLPAAD